MHKIVELFGVNTSLKDIDWEKIFREQICPYSNKRCYKIRKSQPNVSIGTCTVLYGVENLPIIICPNRLLQNRKVFMDCIHLLQLHQPGNDIHIVSEISVPGGSVDYVIASIRNGKVSDFVGIEFQTLDITGTVWTERQKFLKECGINIAELIEEKSYGMNWKMTAKTILMQLLHKVETFEHLGKHLVLIVQDIFFNYMMKEFTFQGINNPALIGDSLQFHSYSIVQRDGQNINLKDRFSTDTKGLAKCLGLNAEIKVELMEIINRIEMKITNDTLLKI
ncbi:MAG: hypothetical protein A2014_05390 [Spirochaetes bacterium GWF1_49_6]|nr:MAG: hypothetical protein A2014_05390 [Spirochaetes bacterium GWF1_49_6]